MNWAMSSFQTSFKHPDRIGIIPLLSQKRALFEEKGFGKNLVLKMVDSPQLSSAFYIELSYQGHQGDNIYGM